MAYEINFTAYKGSDWSVAIEVTDARTDLPFDISKARVDLAVRRRDGGQALSASSADGTIVFPTSGTIRWVLTSEQTGALCAGTTYRVGCRVTTDDGSFQLFTGNLSYIDGEVHS